MNVENKSGVPSLSHSLSLSKGEVQEVIFRIGIAVDFGLRKNPEPGAKTTGGPTKSFLSFKMR